MRDDLLDAQAAVDWAVAQLPVFEAKIAAWRDDAYSIRIDRNAQIGKKAYYVTPNPIPPLFNAEVGAIINMIRSSLDMLAVALAERNGHAAPKDTYFPICDSATVFRDTRRGGGMEKIKRLSAADQAVIENLAPYKGGNDLLYTLHQMDITRKHRRLLVVSRFPRGIGIYREDGGACLVDFSRTWSGFEDQAPVAWTAIDAPDCNVDIGVYITLKESGPVNGDQAVVALNKFASLANSIVKLFGVP